MPPPNVRGGGPPDITPDGRPTSRIITSQALTREPSSGITIADRAVQGTAVECVRQALADHDCGPRGSGLRLRARCPVHESRGLTLAVSQGRSGAVVRCHAECATADVLAAIGLTWNDLFDAPRERTPDWKPVRRAEPDPFGDLKRVLRKCVRMINAKTAQEDWRERYPALPSPTVTERVDLAIWGEKRDQDEHFWRVMARWALLACDEKYVREAYEQRALWLRTGKYADRPSDEQSVVLGFRAEDLQRQRQAAAAAA